MEAHYQSAQADFDNQAQLPVWAKTLALRFSQLSLNPAPQGVICGKF